MIRGRACGDRDTQERPILRPSLLVALFAALRSTVRSRLELEAEILALRHQLAVLQRHAPRPPRLGRTDRLLWVLLSRIFPNCRRAVQIVTPDTVVRWRRRGFVVYYGWRTRISLDKDAPVPRATQPPTCGAVVQVPHLGGLQHPCERRAA